MPADKRRCERRTLFGKLQWDRHTSGDIHGLPDNSTGTEVSGHRSRCQSSAPRDTGVPTRTPHLETQESVPELSTYRYRNPYQSSEPRDIVVPTRAQHLETQECLPGLSADRHRSPYQNSVPRDTGVPTRAKLLGNTWAPNSKASV